MPRTWPARWNGFGPIREIWKRSDRPAALRSEEHTSELQSRLHLVCRLLLEKKILSYQYGFHHTAILPRASLIRMRRPRNAVDSSPLLRTTLPRHWAYVIRLRRGEPVVFFYK